MEPTPTHLAPDFAVRLRRSKGRAGRTHSANAKVTRNELNELEAAAAEEGKAVSEWARETLLAAARRPADDVLLTELVAVRLLLINLVRPIAQGKTLTEEQCATISTQVQQNKRRVTKDLEQQYAAKTTKES